MKLTEKEVRKRHVQGTLFAVNACLKEVPVNELITDLFVETNDKYAKELIKRFERQLVLFKIKPKEFTRTLGAFFINTANYIHRNNLYKQYFEFIHYMYVNLNVKGVQRNVISAYLDLLLEQYTQLTPLQHLMSGIKSDGTPMTMREFYPFIEYPLIEVLDKYTKNPGEHLDELWERYRHYGYKVSNFTQLDFLTSEHTLLTNCLFGMARFINESTEDILPENWHLPTLFPRQMPRICESADYYKKALENRRFLIPFGGVVGRYEDSGYIKEILFKERIIYDDMTPVLLFKVTSNDGSAFCGFYDVKYDVFFTYWRDTSQLESAGIMHKSVENFILENYYHLVCEVDYTHRPNLIMNAPGQPQVTWLVSQSSNGGGTREFDRTLYKPVWTEVAPYVRRLPMGASASQEARQRALEMGYLLRPGETFVRPFKRTTYRKDDSIEELQ